jgi:hypothetical protein
MTKRRPAGSIDNIPHCQVEVFCTQLFQQLNDTFRAGVHEFMDQLKAMGQQQARQAAAAAQQQQQQQPQRPASTHLTPMEKLNRQLEGGQLKAAFELVSLAEKPSMTKYTGKFTLYPYTILDGFLCFRISS